MRPFFFATILAALLAACSGAEKPERPVLAVSIEPQKKILEAIAGPGFDVVVLLPPGSDPESFEPTMSQRRSLSDAEAYFPVGYMPFEEKLAADSREQGGTRVVYSTEGIIPVTGTHSHGRGEAHTDVDPHVWTSLRNGKIIAANFAEALSSLRPDSAEVYRARYQRLAAHLDSLDGEASRRLGAAGAHAFAIWHPSLSYFARDYGLHQISVGQESKEISTGRLRHIVDEAREDSVKILFFQKEYDSRLASTLNESMGTRLVTINPLDYDWDGQIMLIVDELAGK